MLLEEDAGGVFIPGSWTVMPPLAAGRLSGRTFTVHHDFDCAGRRTGRGNPDHAAAQDPAAISAPVLLALRQAGAACVGVTCGAEFSVGLSGINPWFGTPRNPGAPGRLPGGACAGAAAAVAAGLADIALAIDAAGSLRVPASYCGVFGFRPSLGAVSIAGVHVVAPSLAAVGWMTATANLLASVGEVLLPDGGPQAEGPLLRLGEAWVNAEPAVAAALRPALEQLEQLRGRAISVSPMPEGLDSMFDHFRTVFGEEVWATLGRLAPAVPPRTAGSDPASRTAGSSLASRTAGPGLAPRSRGQAAGKSLRKGPPAWPRIGPVLARLLDEARQIGPDVAAPGRAFRLMLQGRLRPLLAGGAVLVVPTSPCPAPAGTAPERLLDLVQQSTLGVTAIAELCGLPEVTLPVTRVGDAPVGLSLIGGAGHDRALLALACDAAAILGLPVG